MGRKRKPTELHVLQGTGRKHRMNPNEPTPAAAIPDPPRFLKGYALEEWQEITVELYELGLLTTVDRTALAAYCQAFRTWAEAVEALELKPREGEPPLEKPQLALLQRTKNGNVIQSALVGIAHTAMEQMRKYLTEFGMTPAARAKAVAKKPGGKTESKWAKFGEKKERGNRKRK